jgi:hypothetical protein
LILKLSSTHEVSKKKQNVFLGGGC